MNLFEGQEYRTASKYLHEIENRKFEYGHITENEKMLI